MMVTKQNDGSWMVSKQGALRPIVVESDTMSGALLAMAEMVHAQESEEYAMVQSMSHLSDATHGEGVYGRDWG
jgi:hypothetical protein